MITADIITTTPEVQYKLQYVALTINWLASGYFWSLYSGVKWKGHFVGRALFAQSSALFFMFTVVLASRTFEFPGEDWARVASYFVLSGALVNLAYALWRQQTSEKITFPEHKEDDFDMPNRRKDDPR
jgi:hypothetical protein